MAPTKPKRKPKPKAKAKPKGRARATRRAKATAQPTTVERVVLHSLQPPAAGDRARIRRIPKRGFTNPFKQPAQVVNVRYLGKLAEGVEVTPETLFGAGLVRRPDRPIKLLGMGDVGRKFTIKGVAVSASARTKIEQAGGTIGS